MNISGLQNARYGYKPKLPLVFNNGIKNIAVKRGNVDVVAAEQDKLKKIFPHCYGDGQVTFVQGSGTTNSAPMTLGVILSGGQASGGHNVIAGIFDALKAANSNSTLIGFKGGPSGLVDDKAIIIDSQIIDMHRNTGGFDMIGSGRTKIETAEQFEKSAITVKSRKLDALVIIGGDDSNTNATLLAEYFLKENIPCSVIGVPKTIDGDLKNKHIEISFGFDTATKTYSELIGNIARDAASARKYWHFIKLMGRSASHIALECALQCQPNVALISEEVAEKKLTLSNVTQMICSSIIARANKGMNFGIVLIPEGLIEFIPEFKILISELNDIMAKNESTAKTLSDSKRIDLVSSLLSQASSALYSSLPFDIQIQLIMDRDPHGNVQVSRIETEKLLIAMVEKALSQHKAQGTYKGSFSPLAHFFGYEGRAAFPSNFDADYCYSLGYSAFMLAANGFTGYISCITGLSKPSTEWQAGGIALTSMMNIERRHGTEKPVIKKALVDLNDKPFKAFAKERETWAVESSYLFQGAIQYYGPTCDEPSKTLVLEHSK